MITPYTPWVSGYAVCVSLIELHLTDCSGDIITPLHILPAVLPFTHNFDLWVVFVYAVAVCYHEALIRHMFLRYMSYTVTTLTPELCPHYCPFITHYFTH